MLPGRLSTFGRARTAASAEFSAREARSRSDDRERVRRRGIAGREKRIDALAARYRRKCQVMAERAADPRMANIPGGTTGLIVITDWKEVALPIGDGPGATIPTMVPIHEVDTRLSKELRAHEQQAAQEVGQWATKTEITGSDGGPLNVAFEQAIARIYGTATDDEASDLES